MLRRMELLGFSDLVEMFGVSRSRAEQIVTKRTFPETHYVGRRRTRAWDRDAVLAWAETNRRAPVEPPERQSTPG